jgi:hypothetical protein
MTSAPHPHKGGSATLKQIGRNVYVRVGTATAQWRLRPGFIVIGAQHCGTTSLFRALTAPPAVVRPTFHKGINYFDLNYEHGRGRMQRELRILGR